MPEGKDEDYLDNLLKTMTGEKVEEEEKPVDKSIVTPEQIARQALNNSEELDVSDADKGDMDFDESGNIDSIDDAKEQLTPSELERLANMKLDDIIDDATSENVTVDDLFGHDKKTLDEAVSGDIETETAVGEAAVQKKDFSEEKVVTEENDFSAAEALAAINNETDGKSKKSKKVKKEKKKKSVFSVIKNIFFESIEEDDLEEEKPKQISESENKDEYEKLIDEVYEGKEHVDEQKVPVKGFFAKLKYRLQQRKLENAEQDRLELEAEELDEQDKKKKREEKKASAIENKEKKKEKAKEKKAAKPKKEKKPKEKKPKKVKEPPKPGDILKIKPSSIVLFVLFIAGVVVLIQVMNISIHYGNGVSKAKTYYAAGDYEKAYDSLTGIKLNKNDQTLYEQSSVLMYVQRQYDSYANYMKMNMKTEALNSLIKGLERYNLYCNEARELGVGNQIDSIKKTILEALQSTFKISESESSTLVNMMENDFTKYYTTIEAYGEAAK